MKKILIFLMLLSSANVFAEVQKRVFISFSMPEQLLNQILKSAERNHVTAVLNGLVDDDMRKTFSMLFDLSKKYPALSIQLDPVAFEKYGIDRVPALVVSNEQVFDVLFGNLALEDGITLIKERGDLKGVT